MLALVLDGVGPGRVVRDRPEPEAGPGEAIVEMRLAGVCDTDLQLARGYMGFRGVPGHEFVGVVRACDSERWRDKRVVADINAGCGACEDCHRGAGHHCAKRTVLGIVARDGAFAERLAIPERCLVEVPGGVSDEAAVFAEPLAAALHVLDEAGSLRAGEPVLVLGDGKLGQLIARALAGAGHDVGLVGRHAHKLAIAETAGVRTYLEADAPKGQALVVEATGNAAGLELAMRCVRPRGAIVLKTTVAGPITVDLSPLVIHEVALVGSRCGDMRRAIDALEAKTVDPSPLVEARYPLDRADEALAHAGKKGALKVLIHRA